MPYLVRDNLVFRTLLHKADLGTLDALIELLQRPSLKPYAPGPPAVGRQDRLELPQEGGLSASGGPAQNEELSLRHR